MTKVQLVVFDMAGTTVKDNDNVHAALIHAMEKGGYNISREEANDVMGYPKPFAITELLKIKEPDTSRITEDWVMELHQHFLDEMLDFYRNDPSVEPVSDAEYVFQQLHDRGVKVALDTGFSRDITDVIIERFGWLERGLIDASAASNEVPAGRPYPFMIQSVMAELGVDEPQAVAKVGDTISDLQEGKSANCGWVIGITSGAYRKEVLEQEYHTHLVERLSDILPVLFPS
jgi:phosphonatase-like hydrolase